MKAWPGCNGSVVIERSTVMKSPVDEEQWLAEIVAVAQTSQSLSIEATEQLAAALALSNALTRSRDDGSEATVMAAVRAIEHVNAWAIGDTDKRMAILSEWRQARGQLMNRPLQNIVCRMVLEKNGCTPDQIGEHEMYGDVDPTDIINLFNYGELIHFGRRSEEYDTLAQDPEREGIEHHHFMLAMLGLVHLYFGFAKLIQAALGTNATLTAN